ncbi:MAG: MgtC/SapB family protein [Bacillota bacterium]|nr:MgtC/SapB family protein [Bacillota bacterium]
MMIYILTRIFAAGLLGLLIGLSFKTDKKIPTGRVFFMICMGSALVTIISIEFSTSLSIPWVSDPGRISAQVVSALGFLVSGLIWINKDHQTEGLSVAAGLWVTAILGILIGAGYFLISFLVSIFLAIIQRAAEGNKMNAKRNTTDKES